MSSESEMDGYDGYEEEDEMEDEGEDEGEDEDDEEWGGEWAIKTAWSAV